MGKIFWVTSDGSYGECDSTELLIVSYDALSEDELEGIEEAADYGEEDEIYNIIRDHING